ncbi:hypothetical protein BGW42_007573 [Actinomortierella wolfii]|nr:hypothetical protein BGW42_007573 [Actinomortierella wolfii]
MAAPISTNVFLYPDDDEYPPFVPMGKDDDPILWLDDFIRIAKNYNLSDAAKKDTVGALIAPNARYWYDDNYEKWETFGDFVKAFEKLYQTRSYIERMTMAAERYRQGPQESAAHLISTMESLFRRANIRDNDEKCRLLIASLALNTQIQVRRARLTEYNDIVDLIYHEEDIRLASMVAWAGHDRTRPANSNHSASASTDDQKAQIDKLWVELLDLRRRLNQIERKFTQHPSAIKPTHNVICSKCKQSEH